MTYEPETTKVELDEGIAVFYVELRHGTQKAINVLTRPFLTFPDQPPKLTVKGEGEVKVEGGKSVELDVEAVIRKHGDEIDDLMIVGQVKEWSFGPVNQETLDGLPERIRGRLVKECNLLYGNMGPLAKGGDGN